MNICSLICHIITVVSSLLMYCMITSTRSRWENATNDAVSKYVLDSSDSNLSNKQENKNSIEVTSKEKRYLNFDEKKFATLPKPIQRYLHRALLYTGEDDWEKNIQVISRVDYEQEGTIFLAENKSAHFHGKKYVSTSIMKPGYIWDGTLNIENPFWFLPDMSIYFRDFYMYGNVSAAESKLYGIFPSRIIESNFVPDDFKLMLWFADSLLFPAILLPTDFDGVTWEESKNRINKPYLAKSKHRDDSFSVLVPSTSNSTIEIDFIFNEKGLVASLFADYNTYKNSSDFKHPWEVRFFDYEVLEHGIFAPTRLEIGWWKHDTFQVFMDISCKNITYIIL